MKKFTSLFLSLCIIISCMVGFSVTASADDSGTCGEGLTWTYTASSKTLTISGTGPMGDSPYGWEDYSEQIQNIVIETGVTKIGAAAFCGCTALTGINIPAGVTEICSNAFEGCTSLTSVTIPNSVTKIEGYAFNGCSSLTSITIPAGVTEIGSNAFGGCESLQSINIPAGITAIRPNTFYGCTRLTSVTIPNSVTKIWGNAFEGCTSLTSITIPASVTFIGSGAFKDCTNLTSITFEGTAEQWAALATTTNIPAGCTVIKQGYSFVPAVAPTCTTAGNIAYYSKDNKKFTKSGTTFTEVTNESALTVAALGHDMTEYAAVAKTCTTAGNSAYKYCSRCKKYFDADGNEITENSWVIPASHTLTAHAAVAKTCTEAGNSAYWECTACHNYFSDANGTTKIDADSWIIPAGHTLTHVHAKAATCKATGVAEHWKCTACGTLFSDAEGKHETTLAAVTTAKTNNHNFVNGKCTVCGAADPNYKEPEPQPDPAPSNYTPSTPSTPSINPVSTEQTPKPTVTDVDTPPTNPTVTNAPSSVTIKSGQKAKIHVKKLVRIANLGKDQKTRIKIKLPKGLKYSFNDGVLKVSPTKKGTYTIKFTVEIISTVTGETVYTTTLRFKIKVK